MPVDRSAQRKDGVGSNSPVKPHAASHRKSEARRRIFRELVHMAAEQGASISLGVSTGDALQECLDRAVAIWRFAADQVDSITPPQALDPSHPDYDPDSSLANLPTHEDPLFHVITNPQGPDLIVRHRYIEMEREARLEIEKLAAMMTQLGIAERVVRVEEAKATLMVAAVREAAMEAGLDHDQIRRLGAALRDKVADGLGQARSSPSHGTVQATQQARQTMRAAEHDTRPPAPLDLPAPSSR
jgi:hypothetical protein